MNDRGGAVAFPLSPATSRLRLAELVLGILLVALVAGGYWIKLRPTPTLTGQDALMKDGLDALYTRGEPEAAVGRFRKVLTMNPDHYGATYQLAVALDRAGRPAEARPYWEKARTMAEEAKDEQTLATARARLEKREAMSEEESQVALMSAGLDALYKRNDPAAAAASFRQVLGRNPNHYGATFQLAQALDRAGKPAEARPLWEKLVKMAEGYNDKNTLAAARARLARTP
jgi:tetratricopeptide (TPR) repeat protein